MRAIILAAGSGTRMGKYTKNIPKGMLEFNGKSLISWQIKQLEHCGITNIHIVTGYQKEAINFPGVTFFHNPHYATTNMVESLMCAREIFDTTCIITYADILFTKELIRLVLETNRDIGVAVDKNWREYWKLRYGTTETDLETLSLAEDGSIKELGRTVSSSENIAFRYIGLIKFSQYGLAEVEKLYTMKQQTGETWKQSGKPFEQGYMTDLLHELIENRVKIYPIISQGGWLEFDTETDYELYTNLLKEGKFEPSFFETL